MKRTKWIAGGALAAALLLSPAAGLAEWSDGTLFDRTVRADVPEAGEDAVTIEGRRNAVDPRTFDVITTVAGHRLPVVTIYTGGRVGDFRHELIDLPVRDALVRLTLQYRHDADQRVCAAGVEGACAATLPVDVLDTGWIKDRSSEAALYLRVQTQVDDAILIDRTFAIPLAGQVVGSVGNA